MRWESEDLGGAVLKVGRRGREVGVGVGGVSIRAPGMVFGKSSVDVFPFPLGETIPLIVETGGFILAVGKDVDVVESFLGDAGRSRPVVAANLICMDSGTPPGLTQGRIVNWLCGRSKSTHQLSTQSTKEG